MGEPEVEAEWDRGRIWGSFFLSFFYMKMCVLLGMSIMSGKSFYKKPNNSEDKDKPTVIKKKYT